MYLCIIFYSATENGHLEIVKYFMEEVEDIAKDPKDFNELRPIDVAVKYGHIEIIKYFLEKVDGIDKKPKYVRVQKPKDINGRTLLHKTAMLGIEYLPVLKYLMKSLGNVGDGLDSRNSLCTIFMILLTL